ncbi:MAG: hypothetical protein BGN92_01585 [Sphingobacteriales bacterium 41-5]|nr:MAG: hypothetical protein BGN92_01585 [Sphingobacteriales bacterium 41-5]
MKLKGVGIKQIASEAGVSIATVDRVLHNRGGVNAKTHEKIKELIKKYNYQPNILAKRLASKKIIRFAAILPRATEDLAYWAAPLDGIKQAAEQIRHYGLEIEVFFYDLTNEESFRKASAKILKADFQGVVIASVFPGEAIPLSIACDLRNIPYVYIDTNISDMNNLSYVGADLFKSGYSVAHLVDYLVKDSDKILICNISKYAGSASDAKDKEEGFRSYFNNKSRDVNMLRINIESSDKSVIKRKLKDVILKQRPKIVIVLNSRAFYVAEVLKSIGQSNIFLIGYDFIPTNIEYLTSGEIDFLVCHRSREQGYLGVFSLYNFVVKKEMVEKSLYSPIDIITKENFEFYRN